MPTPPNAQEGMLSPLLLSLEARGLGGSTSEVPQLLPPQKASQLKDPFWCPHPTSQRSPIRVVRSPISKMRGSGCPTDL